MTLTKLIPECLKAGRVYIAGHKNPDSDSVGACFAAALALRDLGVTPIVLLEKYSDKFGFLSGNEFVYHGDYETLAPEVMICLDCASLSRLGAASQVLARAGSTYNIDHHISNESFAMVNVIDPAASSTCEMVYRMIKDIGGGITREIAEALYTGIIGDTGVFRHRTVSPDTHYIAGDLIKTGFDFSDIQRRTIYEHSLAETRVFGKAASGMKVIQELGFAYACLSLDDLNEVKATGLDLDGIPEYILNTKGVEAAALLSEREKGVISVSLRSVKINVGRIAAGFSGGGHINAAGCKITGSMANALERLVKAVGEAHGS